MIGFIRRKKRTVEFCCNITELFENFKKKFFDENLTNVYVISFSII